MKNVARKVPYRATKNACKLCTPLGASLVFKGIQGAVPLLHGSQGCSTYIRRYLISHFKEPVDIACSNFAEETAIFGGGVNLKTALENIRLQYHPALIGVATTCLSETIGDDVPMFIRDYQKEGVHPLPHIVHVSTPSYQGSHMQGFHAAVTAVVKALAGDAAGRQPLTVNCFPGMLSPADLRHIKEIFDDFGLSYMMLPDYSRTLDGALWQEYESIPPGGTPVDAIQQAGRAMGSLEFGRIHAKDHETAGHWLEKQYGIPCYNLGLPMGIEESDAFFTLLETITGKPRPSKYADERGRLIDALVDGHKYVNGVRAVVYGEEDLVVGLAALLSEIGVMPVLCASGGRSGHLAEQIMQVVPKAWRGMVQAMEDVDFVDIETIAKRLKPDLFIGNSKGYTMARRLQVPLLRVGFPIHDRIGAARILHVGYRGTQELFDRIANCMIEKRQAGSAVGYTYM